MSTLGEHKRNGNPTATSLQREDTKEQIDGILQHFDVLPSRFDRVIFKYIYVFVIGTYLLSELLSIPLIFPQGISSFQVGKFLLLSGLGVFPVVVISLVIGRFNVWRLRTPKTLRDLLERAPGLVRVSQVEIRLAEQHQRLGLVAAGRIGCDQGAQPPDGGQRVIPVEVETGYVHLVRSEQPDRILRHPV